MNRTRPVTHSGASVFARLSVLAIFLIATLVAIPTSVSARSPMISALFAQGASQEVNPVAAKASAQDDDDDEDVDEDAEDEDAQDEDDEDEDEPTRKKTPTPDEDELPEEWYDAGLISETEYESPQFGYEVEWDDPWVLDEYYESADYEGTVVTDSEDSGADLIHIWIEDSDAILRIQGSENANELTGEDYLEYWESDDYLEGFTSDATSLAIEGDEDVAATLYYLDSGFIGYNQVSVADRGDTLIFLFFLAPVDNFEEAFELAQDEIQFDGEATFDVFRSRDVDNAIEDYLP